jgi:MFS family permease
MTLRISSEWSLLRTYPAFGRLFASRFVNQIGTSFGGIALIFAVLEVSNSPSALGIVLAAYSIPMVIFLFAGGVLSDRGDRVAIMQVTNIVAGVCQALGGVLVLMGHAEVWQLAALSAVLGVAGAASIPAASGVVPQLVPEAELQKANATLSLSRSSVNILGPALRSMGRTGVCWDCETVGCLLAA